MLYPKGSQDREYPKDLNYRTISKSMMGHKNLDCGYQTTFRQYKYSEEQEQRDAKFATTPHRRSTVLVKHFTYRIHLKLGRTRKPIRKKLSFDVQAPNITRRGQILHAEKRAKLYVHIYSDGV
jgi:hypothetical protein